MVVGARLMAAGKYVSVSSQSDTENADLTRERLELATLPEDELDELAAIYVGRGLDESLARQVAIQLTSHDAPGAHARDELGISGLTNAQTVQAPLASLMADNLDHLPLAIGLSRATRRIIRQNLWMSLGMVAFLVPATIFGLNIGPAVALHEGSTLIVVFNALRLLAYKE
jgi:VIT1/CCC1 family predicted Fe2+/Mn2+ transporter